MSVTISEDDFDDIKDIYYSLHRQVEKLSTESPVIPKLMGQINSLKVILDKVEKTQYGGVTAELQSSQTFGESYVQGQRKLTELLMTFEEKCACYPQKKIEKIFEHSSPIREKLTAYLRHNCDFRKIENTGSVYEGLKTCSAILEIDIMVVLNSSGLELVANEGVKNGYSLLRTDFPVNFYNGRACDDEGYLKPDKFRSLFFGDIKKWANSCEKIDVHDHGPAVLLEIEYDGSTYQIDITVCFHFDTPSGKQLYVPKPLKDEENMIAWRRSYSKEERDKCNGMIGSGGCQLRVARTVKALLQLNPDGVFKPLTSYHIKTVLFHLAEEFTEWKHEQFVECVIEFLSKLKSFLGERRLLHYYEETIDLFADIKEHCFKRMEGQMEGYLNDKTKFCSYIQKIMGY